MDYLIIFGRSLFFYILIVFLYRLMGKREVAELSIMDLIVSIFIAQIASIAIEGYDESIFHALIPIGVLVGLQLISSYVKLRNTEVRDVIDGKSSLIINKGKIVFSEMEKQRYNLYELLSELRQQGIKSIEDVDYAVLETNGNLSIFKKQDDTKRTFPMPVIVDGEVQDETLAQIGKTIKWLNKELQFENLNVDDVFYAFYKDKNLFIIQKDNKNLQNS